MILNRQIKLSDNESLNWVVYDRKKGICPFCRERYKRRLVDRLENKKTKTTFECEYGHLWIEKE
jgi:hypothetical protein